METVSSLSGSRWRRWWWWREEEEQCWGTTPVTLCLGLARQNLQSQSKRLPPTVEQCGLQWGRVEGCSAHRGGGGGGRGGRGREAPRCHRVLPARVLPVGTQSCQGNRLPPADRARPQQVPLDVLWESRSELRLSLQSCDPGVRPHRKRVCGIVEQRVPELVQLPGPWGHHQLEPLSRQEALRGGVAGHRAQRQQQESSCTHLRPQPGICVARASTTCCHLHLLHQELLDRPHGDVCDVIGLLTFSGRAERIRSQDGGSKGEVSEYRWLRLEDGSSDRPVVLKLFSTSQPDAHNKLHPMSVVVCTRLKVVRSAGWTGVTFYLTNTVYTQVYCTGLGHHSRMSYRKLRPVQRFLQWLRSQDDRRVLSRAVVGGFYVFPPPPTSLEAFMSSRQGKPGLVRGAEFEREVERLCYRERQTLCIQATVTMVAHSRRGEEERCLFWTHRASPCTPPRSSSPPTSSRFSTSSPHPSPSRSFSSSTSSALPPLSPPPPPLRSPLRSTPSSSSFFTPPSSDSGRLRAHHPYSRTSRKSWRRKLLQADTPCRKQPSATLQSEDSNCSVVLFQASMEFLGNEDGDTDDDEAASFAGGPQRPALRPVALETLPMRYDHGRREEQVAAVAIEGQLHTGRKFAFACDHYFTLRLKALSDDVLVDAVFLPDAQPTSHQHANTWLSILSHGAFSSHAPPPSPADLIEMASQLANQRLICVLEVCHLGGATTEIILSRVFLLEG
ncbi:uncharacterized protein LOC142894066 isoform X5 [Nelusetta ayraudi]|uniref:uncharacterized protein LOC142894066 isoform X5 n=1 Tax=Nelusetta ayraudi TaxID=303726 RepID=UPI003F70B836